MHEDGKYDTQMSGKFDVKMYVENLKKLRGSERFELLQCVYDKEAKDGGFNRQFKVNRFSVKPYISRKDGSIYQFVCECYDEPMSKAMQTAVLRDEVFLD
jgi:hypothetical protein